MNTVLTSLEGALDWSYNTVCFNCNLYKEFATHFFIRLK